MKKSAVVAGAVIVSVVLAGFTFHATARLSDVESTDDAYIKADSIVLSPKISGYVTDVLVHDNQWVKADQPLAKIDPRDFQVKLDQQVASLASAKAEFDTLKNEEQLQANVIAEAEAAIAGSEAQVTKAAVDYERDQALLKRGYCTQDELESARLALDIAQSSRQRVTAALAAARQKLNVLHARESELQAKIGQLEAVSASAKLDLSHTTLTAPRAGYVGNKGVQVGEYVKTGAQLMFIVPTDATYVVANFKETQVRRLHPGQRARISVDAYPDLEVHGQIDSLAPAAGAEFSLLPPENAVGNFTRIVQRIPVKISLTSSNELTSRLKPGMSAQVVIETGSAK